MFLTVTRKKKQFLGKNRLCKGVELAGERVCDQWGNTVFNCLFLDKRDVGNTILKTYSKTASAIFSANDALIGVFLLW